MRVSVVIPAYNCAEYLPETLECVFSQTFQDFEVVLIDDGSTDNTAEICAGFAQKYPQKFRYIRQERRGVSAARNHGIHEAYAEYIAFLDADDTWVSDKLAKQFALIDSLQDKDVVIYGGSSIFDESGLVVRCMFDQRKPHDGYVFEKLLYENFLSTHTVVLRRSLFEKAGYFKEDSSHCEDYDLWLRLARHFKFYYVTDVIAGYRVHSRQGSADFYKIRNACFAMLDEITRDLKNKRLVADALSYQHFQYGCEFKRRGLLQDARYEFKASLSNRFKLKTLAFFVLTF